MRRVAQHISRFQRLGALVVFILLAGGHPSAAMADEAVPAGNSADVGSADVGNVDVGRVFSVRSLLGRKVSGSDSKPLGVVSDVAIDLDDANIAMIALGEKHQPEGSASSGPAAVWLVPARLLPKLSDDKNPLQLTAALPKEARLDSTDWRTTADRDWLGKTLGQKDKIPGNEPPVYTKFAWVSTLTGKPVTNPKGETLAAIGDVALTRDPLHVAYLVLGPAGSDDKAARAWGVPLSALVVPLTETSWQLELPPDRLAVIPKIDPRNLPRKIDRAWEEYVSVSYGGAIDDGTQPELRAK